MTASLERLERTLAGRYRITRELGRGGMATVYLATDLKHRRDVAVKVLAPDVAAALAHDRFLREIEIVARLNHPHIVALFDSGVDDELLYYVMPCVNGESLRALLNREGALSVDHALRLTREIASALFHAHQHGIVHRDIKPENILLADGIAVVADFGIGRALRAASDTRSGGVTQAGLVLGTPQYMSPEQASGDPVDERSDIYALACVLFEMLAGRPPFPAMTAFAVMAAHVNDIAPRVSDLVPSVSPAVSDVIATALAKAPEHRYASSVRFAEALASAAATSASTPSSLAPAPVAGSRLPVQRTRFVGREKEIEQCRAVMRTNRMLTLTGIGGCGKTRLALAVAGAQSSDYPDGIWFVDLASLNDGLRVMDAIAAALGLSEAPGRDLADVVGDSVADKRALLVLDNCEHLERACADAADRLLRASESLTMLATSREPLGVDCETVFPVRPLSVPATDSPRTVDALRDAESVRLFVDRAQLAAPGFVLGEHNAAAVGEICRRLDGIPLAIELAAARVKVLSVEQIRARLDDRFRLLAGSSKAVLPRHQTLVAAIQWSHDQLPEPDQQLFRAYSAFAGGWTLSAATAMSGNGADEFAVLDALGRLVDKCLVFVEPAIAGTAETRYGMLETVRQFGRERLVQAQEADVVRRRHFEVFSAVAERAYEERTSRETVWTRLLDAEHDNMRSALEWARETSAEDYLRLAGALGWFWQACSHVIEGRVHLTAALSGSTERTAMRARALAGLGTMLGWQGDGAAAIRHLEEAIAIWRELGILGEVALGLESLGWAWVVAGEDERGASTFFECLRIQQERGDPVLINRAKVGLAQAQVALSRVTEARALAEDVIAFSAARQDLRNEHFGWHFMADCALIEGNCAESLPLYQKSLQLAQAMGDRIEIGFEVQGVGMSLAGLGNGQQALRLISATKAEWKRMGVEMQIRFWNELLNRYVATAKGGLDAGVANRAWDDGTAMVFDDAIAAALATPAHAAILPSAS
jgi:non-specific serine/threonine protein kinase